MSSRPPSQTRAAALSGFLASRTSLRLIGVAIFALATAVGARVAIPLPGTPVPFTLQVLCVLLAGALLGARLGAASQLLYVLLGVLGAPLFAFGGGPAYLLGPTGGYLLAFPLAAWAVGALAPRSGGAARLIVGLIVGVAVIHAGGVAWLAVVTGSFEQAVRFGVGPFVALDLLKIALASLISLKFRRRALELF